MIFYKYRTNSAFTDKIFTDKKVWLSNAANLNDPFECTIQEIAKDWIEENVIKLKRGHIEGFVMSGLNSIKTKTSFYGLTAKQTKEFFGRFIKKDLDAQYKTTREFIFRKVGRELSDPELTYINFDEQLNDVGIFSMSETSENQLMWAHYGENSKGIAIGFENAKDSKLSNSKHCLKVNYSDELPAFKREGFNVQTSFYGHGSNTQKIAFDDVTFQAAISTKPNCWEYEKEWRYVEETAGSYDYPGTLKELIFGLKCPADVRNHYITLLNANQMREVELFEIVIIPNTNQIRKIRM